MGLHRCSGDGDGSEQGAWTPAGGLEPAAATHVTVSLLCSSYEELDQIQNYSGNVTFEGFKAAGETFAS